MHLYLDALRKYADFSGRSSRAEYWTFELTNALVLGALFALGSTVGLTGGGGLEAIAMPCYMAVLLPSMAVRVRRLHDTGRSAWHLLVALIPLGWLILLVYAFGDSQPGENRYGSNPKESVRQPF